MIWKWSSLIPVNKIFWILKFPRWNGIILLLITIVVSSVVDVNVIKLFWVSLKKKPTRTRTTLNFIHLTDFCNFMEGEMSCCVETHSGFLFHGALLWYRGGLLIATRVYNNQIRSCILISMKSSFTPNTHISYVSGPLVFMRFETDCCSWVLHPDWSEGEGQWQQELTGLMFLNQ